MKNKNIKIIKGLNDAWKEVSDSKTGYPQSTLIIKSDFAKENPEFVKAFIEEISNSIKWLNENSKDAGIYAKEFGVSTEPTVIEKSIERSNLKFVKILEMQKEYEDYYQKLYDFEPKTVGGKLPDEGIFYKGE